jgi:MoaA/NifB/PqqE/SkfB family radical SAM enzyme
MPNQKIFCSVPWTNTHIYWDGSFGVCCSESEKPYELTQSEQYNLKNMTVQQWYNDRPMIEFRKKILSDAPLVNCNACYSEENFNYESRRIRENFKTVIFTEHNFYKSFRQTHWNQRFESAHTESKQHPPIDWHIDLGNECNLSCKMCGPWASSQIASKYRTWGIPVEKKQNWTENVDSYKNFLNSLKFCRPTRLHFMGGEPMLSKKFKSIVEFLIDENLNAETSISFVSNGTILDLEFVNLLLNFKSVDIEISLESVHDNNHYIRQGSDTDSVIKNILLLKTLQNSKFQLVLRSVPQLLNINNYNDYIEWAWNHKFSIQGIPLTRPEYLSINVLPLDLRKSFVHRYEKVKNKILAEANRKTSVLVTGRDASRLDIQLVKECESMIYFLNQPDHVRQHQLQKELVFWLNRWDDVYNIDARKFYPEYSNFLDAIGYGSL